MSAGLEFHDMLLAALKADAAVNALVEGRVIDGPLPKGSTPLPDKEFPCITFGDTSSVPDDEECVAGVIEVHSLDLWTRESGKAWVMKELAGAVRQALHEFDGTLATATLSSCRVVLVRTFRDPDGITMRGVVQVEGQIEE